MMVDEKPQLKENDETQLKEKEATQLEVNEKTRLNRRILIIIGIALALVVTLLLAVTTVNFLAGPPRDCPWTKNQCFTQPHITKFYRPNLPVCFNCSGE